MKMRKYSMAASTVGLSALMMSAVAATAMAQTSPPSHDKMSQHQDDMQGMKGMKDMKGMSGMMVGPHHVLAMAYGDNLATFARALQGQVTRSKSVDLEMARPAVAEMTRSFDQMKQHHAAQMEMMGDQSPPMAGMEQQHDTQVVSLGEHLTALQSEVSLGAPDPKKIAAHTTEILKLCARMSSMSGKSKTHSMK